MILEFSIQINRLHLLGGRQRELYRENSGHLCPWYVLLNLYARDGCEPVVQIIRYPTAYHSLADHTISIQSLVDSLYDSRGGRVCGNVPFNEK